MVAQQPSKVPDSLDTEEYENSFGSAIGISRLLWVEQLHNVRDLAVIFAKILSCSLHFCQDRSRTTRNVEPVG